MITQTTCITKPPSHNPFVALTSVDKEEEAEEEEEEEERKKNKFSSRQVTDIQYAGEP